MRYTFADRFLDGVDDLIRGWRGWTKADHAQYFNLVCADRINSMALSNGSLLSVIEIEGYMGQYIPDHFRELVVTWATFMRTNANDRTYKGFDLFWSYEYDPEGMVDAMKQARLPMLHAAKRRGINIKDMLEEEAEVYGSVCASERQLLLIVTHIDAIPKAEHKKAREETNKNIQAASKGRNAMLRGVGVPALRIVHEQHVAKVQNFLKEAGYGYSAKRLDAYELLAAMRKSLLPGTTSKGWRPRLTLKDTALRATDQVHITELRREEFESMKPHDFTFMLPPKLQQQMMPETAVDLGRFAIIGDRAYAPLFVEELAVEPEPLEHLLRGLYRHRLPVRIVYSLTSNSEQANYWNRLFASSFSWLSDSNKQINAANDALKKYRLQGGAVMGYGLSITTWAKPDVTYGADGSVQYNLAKLEERVRDLETILQQWGGQQLTNLHGCSIEAALSATPGYMIPPACPLAPQIEYDILAQLPLMRPAKLWSPETSIWFRTGDGALMPHQPMSGRQNTMISLVLGGMGYGKSNCISEFINFFANHPQVETMPYIRGMDFGASASGVVDIIQQSLPENRRHEAIFEFFANDGSMVKNLLDTPLGCYYPLGDHETFLINWLTTLVDEVVAGTQGVSTIASILKMAIKRAYQRKDPRRAGSEPNLYNAYMAPAVVREWVEKLAIETDEHTCWWEIVHALAAYGVEHSNSQAIYAARVAQRYAVPLLFDVIVATSSLATEYASAPTINGIPLTDALANAMKNANELFPCFNGVTNRDISESRVCVFDMSNVFQRGEGTVAVWRRAVFFMTALRLLTEDLFISKRETGEEMGLRQDELGLTGDLLKWHYRYLEQQDQIQKIFWGDELHRIGKVSGAFSTLEQMGMEGRKYRVGLLLGTQLPEHLPEALLTLFSSAFIFGVSQSSEKAAVIGKIFDLTPDECKDVENITKPNAEKGAEVFCIHKVDTRIQKVKLHFNLGPLKRWAYATEANERTLRSYLYDRGPSTAWARKVLAERVPDLQKEIKRRLERQDASGSEGISESEVIKQIAEELLEQAKARNHVSN